jgi:hypothetical protein
MMQFIYSVLDAPNVAVLCLCSTNSVQDMPYELLALLLTFWNEKLTFRFIYIQNITLLVYSIISKLFFPDGDNKDYPKMNQYYSMQEETGLPEGSLRSFVDSNWKMFPHRRPKVKVYISDTTGYCREWTPVALVHKRHSTNNMFIYRCTTFDPIHIANEYMII